MGNLKDAIRNLNVSSRDTVGFSTEPTKVQATQVHIEQNETTSRGPKEKDVTLPVGKLSVSTANITMPTLAAVEKEYLIAILSHTKGNKSQAAKILGITIKTLYNKLHAYGEFDRYATKNRYTITQGDV